MRINASRIRTLMTYKNDLMGGAEPITFATTSIYNGPGDKYSGITISLSGQSASLNIGQSFDVYQRQANVVDNLTWAMGAHQFKFGFDYRRMYPIYGPREYYQSLTFNNIANITAGTINSISINAYPTAVIIYPNFSSFAQDTWKLSSRLTMDLGVRWEINPAPSEETGKMPVTVLGIVGYDSKNAYMAPPGTPFYKTFYTAFGPRIGLAYQLNQASGRETVLRGGFGLFYDLNSGQVAKAFAFGFPNVATKSIASGTTFPVPVPLNEPPSIPVVSLPLQGAAYALNQDLKLPIGYQWNLTLEQALGTKQSVSLAYVASASRNLMMTQNINAPVGYTSGGPRPNPNFQYIYYTDNGPTADYHSLQAQYKARLKQGLQALVNYTWAHAIDEVSNDITGYDFNRSNATFDVRHNFSAAFTYAIPKLRSTGPLSTPIAAVAKALVRDWSVDGIIHAKTGRPLDIIASQAFVEDGEMVTGRPDVVPGAPYYLADPAVPSGRRFNVLAFAKPPASATYPTQQGRQGTFGRNILRELSMYQIDLGLARDFPLKETWKLQFKGEMYNIFNHPLFGNYNLTWSATSTTFGVPTTSLARRLGGLNRLYQIGGPRSIQFTLKLSF